MKYRLSGTAASFGRPVRAEVGGKPQTIIWTGREFPSRSVAALLVEHTWRAWVGVDVVVTKRADHLAVSGTLDSSVELQSRVVEDIYGGRLKHLSIRLDQHGVPECR